MILRNLRQRNDAVSPVIGVMLMLVVTIIIAGVVTAFTTGIVDTTSVVPNAYFDVNINIDESVTGDDYCIMTIEHLGGDSIDTSELQIVTYYSYTPAITDSYSKPVRSTKTTTVLSSVTPITESGPAAIVPYLADVGVGNPGDTTVNFGSFEFSAGDVMTTGTSAGTASILGLGSANSYSALTSAVSAGNSNGFGLYSKVEVRILHQPTNTVLFDKEVTVA